MLVESDFPKFVIVQANTNVTEAGIWEYAGTSAGTWTMAVRDPQPTSGQARRTGSGMYTITVLGTAAPVTLSRASADQFHDAGQIVNSILIVPGETVDLFNDGGYWVVRRGSTSYRRVAAAQTGASLTLDRSASVWTFTGTSAAAWTLPAVAVNKGLEYTLSNRGTAAITLSPAGADTLSTGQVTVPSVTITPGSTVTVINDGSTWFVDGSASRQLASGRYYGIPLLPFTAANPTLNRLRLVPWIVPETGLYDRIASRVTTAAAGATLRWGIYREVGGLPVTQLFDTGAVGDASTIGLKEATISQVLQAGERVWPCVVAQGVDGAFIVLSSGSTSAPDVGMTAADVAATTNGIAAGYYVDGVTAALPAPFSTYNVTTGAPGIWLRKA